MCEKRTRKEKQSLLWSKDLLGDKNAQTLLYSLYFYIGKIFSGLRPCEHRELRLNSFVIEDIIQLEVTIASEVLPYSI